MPPLPENQPPPVNHRRSFWAMLALAVGCFFLFPLTRYFPAQTVSMAAINVTSGSVARQLSTEEFSQIGQARNAFGEFHLTKVSMLGIAILTVGLFAAWRAAALSPTVFPNHPKRQLWFWVAAGVALACTGLFFLGADRLPQMYYYAHKFSTQASSQSTFSIVVVLLASVALIAGILATWASPGAFPKHGALARRLGAAICALWFFVIFA